MRSKFFVPLLIVGVSIAAFVILSSGGNEEADAERIAREQARRRAETDDVPIDQEKVDFDALARDGKGQQVPESLSVHPSPDKSYWFVGNKKIKAGVEIPFAPGRLPTPPPADLEPIHPNPGFVGADACQSCHPQKHASFIETAHHRTSLPALPINVKGKFAPDQNRMATVDPNVHFTMLERDERLFQRVAFHNWKFEVPFDLITGSSKMAQTYLYWHGDQLFQMNVTYLSSVDDWINSPGYVDGDAAYARPIPVRCLECHTTYADLREPPNHYTPSSLILGISCERCHGPGKDHIEYHQANPTEKESKFVSVPSKLTRQQQLDVCGQCHSGVSSPKDKAFQFRPGDKFSDHYEPLKKKGESNNVHTSNQLRRLAESECFNQSEMGCVECHDPHQNERGKMELFSQRCLECHQSEKCGMSETLGASIVDNCVDCHMPKKAGEFLRLDTSEGSIFPPLRDHYIRVDQEATKKFMESRQ
ncbi:MAG: multiheme c-type cytochrome [Rubripirellula sp.]